jgi:hypothetical protein
MKRTLLTALTSVFLAGLLLTAAARPAHATDVGYGRKFGLGVVLGDPAGISAKYWLGATNALDFALGFVDYGPYNYYCPNNPNQRCFGAYNPNISADYLWQSKLVRSTAQLDWYIGLGGRAYFWGDYSYRYGFDLAARAPIGLALMFNNPSALEVFVELVPQLHLVQSFGFDPSGGLGARYYF